jgi:spore maturation protein CgeB
MHFALFYHSVRSDWNHGNAHFLRGLIRELQQLGHTCMVYEPVSGWSLQNLLRDHGPAPLEAFARRFSFIQWDTYDLDREASHEVARRALRDADVCIVHEWTVDDPGQRIALAHALIAEAARRDVLVLYHDTHYRAVEEPAYVRELPLERFSAVLAFGPSLADVYRSMYGLRHVEVFHEAADTALFRPVAPEQPPADVLFIGNWAGDDRSIELQSYLLEPARRLPELRFVVYGVRYPAEVVARLAQEYGIEYRGWLPNADTPGAYAAAKVTLHVPRRQYAGWLYGIPTIRVFEALACGTCLVSTPWADVDGLFRRGLDFTTAWTPEHMCDLLAWLCHDACARHGFGQRGRETVLARHTCAHRARQLIAIIDALRRDGRRADEPAGGPGVWSSVR